MATESVSGATEHDGGGIVVVTGAAGVLGRQVVATVAADPSVALVVAIDQHPVASAPGVVGQVVDLASADLKPLFEGARAVLHLAQADEGAVTDDAGLAHRVLDAAGATGVAHLVLLSSAAAYGAWANNPVPITEDALLRPNPNVAVLAAKAEIERAAADFRDDHPGTTVTLLRPTVTVSPEGNGWLARVLKRSSLVPVTDDDPPAQFLDVADLAAAVDLARRARIDGPRNVAPDGWIDGDAARSLAGAGPRVRLPERLALRLARTRASLGLKVTPPELLPYVVHPWVVANDRLKADGWVPTSTNEEAYVASHRATPLQTISPSRRQELALGGTGVAIVGITVGLVVAVRRRARRSR